MVGFKPGDRVRLIEPYRTQRLICRPNDYVGNAQWVTVKSYNPGTFGGLLCFEEAEGTWIPKAFVLADVGVPW